MNSSSAFLSLLNEPQKEAVKHTDGPLLVFAGAGSGKTRVITNRIAYLIAQHKAEPENILAVTFTKKASAEMLDRVRLILKEIGVQQGRIPTVGTFHSICAMILRQNAELVGLNSRFSIYDTHDSESLIKDILIERGIDIKQIKPQSIAYYIGVAKNDFVSPEEFKNHYSGFIQDVVSDIYPEYQKQMLIQNSVDFGDLLFLTVKLLSTNKIVLERYQEKYKYIMIDEYQDTNAVQYRFAKLLSQKYENICVVGDDDQGIYAWRGADIKNIQSFEEDFKNVKVVKLEQNYRSTKVVIEAATSIIKQNNSRVEKELWTDKGKGDCITVYQANDQEDEAEYVVQEIKSLDRKGVELKNMAVLYRTNYQSRVIEEFLIKSGLPYKLVGGFRFYDRQEIKDILGYLRFVVNLKDELSLHRILNVPTRKVGPKSVEDLHKLAKKTDCTIGELLVTAYLVNNPEYITQLKTFKSKVEKAKQFENEFKKFNHLINLFGSIYVESLGQDALKTTEKILRKTDYVRWIDDGSEQAQYKKENIEEFKNVANRYANEYGIESLNIFLQEIALIEQEQEKNKDGSGSSINLMTLHSSKGLEFDFVFMIGMEEGIMPHSRSFTDQNELEEERRLCYVGITRAREKLVMTFAKRRLTREGYSDQIPSRFLSEIPQDICEYYSSNY